MSLNKFVAGLMVIFGAVICRSMFAVPAEMNTPMPEWRPLEGEAVTMLSRYIQVDTTNPPGNEIEAARFLKEIFDREGIESRIIE